MEKIENASIDKIAPGFVLIRIYHPAEKLDNFSSLLSMPCFRSWVAGSPRQTPRGQLLAGTNQESYWCSEPIEFSAKEGFKRNITEAIECLLHIKNEIQNLRSTGGRFEVYLQLPGCINNGDTITSTYLQIFGELGVDLLIEVFPKTKSRNA